MVRKLFVTSIGVAALSVWACSSTSSSSPAADAGAGGGGGVDGSTASGSYDCAAACKNFAAVGAKSPCKNDVPPPTEASCLTDCGNIATLPAACKPQADAFLACAATTKTATCDSEGHSQPGGCEDKQAAIETCARANTDGGSGPGDGGSTACDKCMAANCMQEASACMADPDCAKILDCARSGTTNTADCTSKNPDGGTLFEAVAQCSQTKCSADCK